MPPRRAFPSSAASTAPAPGDAWIEYAAAMQQAGASALELNIFLLPTDRRASAQEIESHYAGIVRKVVAEVTIPVSVKLPMRLTNVLSVGDALLGRGAGGLVLYNRFFEPDIDIEKMCLVNGDPFSEPGELRNVLRSTALCAHALPQLDIAVSDRASTTGPPRSSRCFAERRRCRSARRSTNTATR